MKPLVAVLCVLLGSVSCRATTTDRDDVAGSQDSAMATFLQPLEVRLRDERILPERNARELNYLGTGYNYSPYSAGHYSPYNPVYGGQHAQFSPYGPYAAGGLGGIGGFGGIGANGIGGYIGTGGFGGGLGGYPAGGQLGYSFGQGGYPYGNGIQNPVGYGNQLAGYYNRGLYV